MQAHVMPIVLGGIASILVSIFGAIVTFKIGKKFDNELDLIEVYVNNRKNIEKTNETTRSQQKRENWTPDCRFGRFSRFPAFISEKMLYIIHSVIFLKQTIEETLLC